MKLSARFAAALCAAAFSAFLCVCGPGYPAMPINTAPPHEADAPAETVPAQEQEAAAPTAAPTLVPSPERTPAEDELVRVSDHIPDIYI